MLVDADQPVISTVDERTCRRHRMLCTSHYTSTL
jgi:hypothetical protein